MPHMSLRGRPLRIALGAVGATAFLLQGWDQALMNGLLTLPDFYTVFPQMDTTTTIGTQKQSNSTIQGTVVAIYEVGCAVGALSCFFIGDVLGRRRTILLAAVFAVAGLALMATSFSLGQLITARVITGLGVGAFTATVPMWVSESSKAHDRGSMVMLEGSFAIGGVCLCTWIEFGLFFAKNNQVNWRLPMAFPSIFAIVVLVLVMFLPESPRWLAAQGRDDEARLALSRLDDLPIDSIFITKDLHEIKNSIDKEHSGYSGSPFALTPNRHLHRTLLAVAVNILAQMCGVNIISFYSNTIFQNTLGFSSTLSRLVTGCLQTWQFICASSALLVVDRIGRRPLLITCAIGMAISQAGLAGLTAHADNKGAAGATLLFNFTSLFFFPVGLFLVPFMYAAEIAPLRIRAKVTSIATCFNWLFNFLIAEVTPVGFASISWKYYIVYVCTGTLAGVVFYMFCPETKGRSLEDIDEIFLQSGSIWDTVKVARALPTGAGALIDEEEVDAVENMHDEKGLRQESA